MADPDLGFGPNSIAILRTLRAMNKLDKMSLANRHSEIAVLVRRSTKLNKQPGGAQLGVVKQSTTSIPLFRQSFLNLYMLQAA
jgi:hypothetical protein